MATVDTASPTVSAREQNPPIGNDRTIAGEIDLSETASWSFLSTFAFPAPDHFPFTYIASGPAVDIGAGRVARQTDSGQEIVTVGGVSGLGLAQGTVNRIYVTGSNTIESRDDTTPPSAESLLIATVDTNDGRVETAVRGRSPIYQFTQGLQESSSPGSGNGTSPAGRTVLPAADMSDGTARFHREHVADGQVLHLYVAGVMDNSLTQTTGLVARVVDESDDSILYSTEQKRAAGTPLLYVFGPGDVRFEIANNSGGSVTQAAPRWVYDVTPGQAVPPTRVILGDNSGAVRAFDAADGSALWSFSTSGEIKSAPTVVNGTVYVGSRDGAVYALSAGNGGEQWRFSNGQQIDASPTIVNGTVYVGSDDYNLYALDAGDGSQQWSQSFSSAITSATKAVNGSLYVAVRSAANMLYALDPADGSTTWSAALDGDPLGPPSVNNGNVYIGTGSNTLYSFDANAGSENWTFDVGSTVQTNPTVANGTVYVGAYNTYAIDAASGSQEWTADTGGGTSSSPVVVNGLVFIGGGDGQMYALDTADGSTIWSTAVDTEIAPAPTVYDGTAYAGDFSGTLFAFDTADGTVQWSSNLADRIESAPTVATTKSIGERVLQRVLGHR